MIRAMRLAPGGVVAIAGMTLHRDRRCLSVRTEEPSRFQELPKRLAMQEFKPAVPYPGWDDNWDYCDLEPKQVAKALGHDWPIHDYAVAIHKLYAEHTDRPASKVDKLIEANKDDLPGLYKRAFSQYAYGGAVTRHIILVRHGQYEEHRSLAKRLHSENPHRFGLPGDTKYPELDRARILTPLGRQQAEKVGDRLATLLQPALTTPGRESHVRIHVSTLTRAKETADLIAARLPSHVKRLDPDPMLVEGDPPAHTIPFQARGGEEALLDHARDVHIEGAKMEAAFRSVFYRDLPCCPPKKVEEKNDEKASETCLPIDGVQNDTVDVTDKKAKRLPRHEYEIVVCHMNLIRYFTLRALQMPPEAWLRLGGNNGSFTHILIRPSGSVSLKSFGDSGHMSLEEITFGMTQGLE